MSFSNKHVSVLRQNALFFLGNPCFLQVCVTNIQYLQIDLEKDSKQVTRTNQNQEWIRCLLRKTRSGNLEIEFFLASAPSSKCWNFLKYFRLRTFWTNNLLVELKSNFVMLPMTHKAQQIVCYSQDSSYFKPKVSFTLLRHQYSSQLQNSFPTCSFICFA